MPGRYSDIIHPEGVIHYSPANIAGEKIHEHATCTPKGCHIIPVMAKVKLFGVLRDRAGDGETELAGDLTILQVLQRLGERYGPEVEKLLLEKKDGRTVKRQPVVILVKGMAQTDLECPLGRDETVSIFPAVAGG